MLSSMERNKFWSESDRMVRHLADDLDDVFEVPPACRQSVKRFEARQHVQRVDCNGQLRRRKWRILRAVALEDHQQAIASALVAGAESLPDLGINRSQRVQTPNHLAIGRPKLREHADEVVQHL